jgi:ribonuclease G
MGKEILVNTANRETRIAVIEDRQLVELRVEREEPVVGNVYKGRVENVLPGMDAAFIDIGLERNAFLYVADILPEAVDQGDESDEEEFVEPTADEDEENFVPEELPSSYIEPDVEIYSAQTATSDDGGPSEALSDVNIDSSAGIAFEEEVDENYAEDAEEEDNDENDSFDLDVDSFEESTNDLDALLGVQIEEAPIPASQTESSEINPKSDPRVNNRRPGAQRPHQKQITRPPRRSSRNQGFRRHFVIQDLVQTKQEVVVQVVKGPRGTKGSRVSTRMSFPGRYLVLMPDANNLGVSRKIEDSRERDRLKKIVDKFRQHGFGIIVRTEAEGKKASELYQDYLMLIETWQQIQQTEKTTPAPGLIHQDLSLIYTIIRDAFGSDVDKLILDSPDDYLRANEIVSKISPELGSRIFLYDGLKPMFEHYRIEDDVERLLRRKVWLRSGGYLVIDQTEALTSIDVNTGKFTGSTGLSETIFQTNMEATIEIARQLRLRDLGGMIILDFIDMDNPRDKKQVTDSLTKALKNDKSRTKISSISPLGLIEMTRKRTKETVDVALTDICPYCHGLGRVPSAESVSMQIEREVNKLSTTVNSEAIIIQAHPDVAAYLIGAEGEDIERLERIVKRAIYVRAQEHWHVEKFEIEPGSMAKIEQSYPLPKRDAILECEIIKNTLSQPPWGSAHVQGGYQIDVANAGKLVGQTARIRLKTAGRSLAIGEALNPGGSSAIKPIAPNKGQEKRGARSGAA